MVLATPVKLNRRCAVGRSFELLPFCTSSTCKSVVMSTHLLATGSQLRGPLAVHKSLDILQHALAVQLRFFRGKSGHHLRANKTH